MIPPNIRETHTLIQGDTYPVKERLKELGGLWDDQMKGWWVPKSNADEARNIVENCEGQMPLWEDEGGSARWP